MTHPQLALIFGSATLLLMSGGPTALAQPAIEAPPVPVDAELLANDSIDAEPVDTDVMGPELAETDSIDGDLSETGSTGVELMELDDPAAPLHFHFPDLERIVRPTGFSNVAVESFDLVVFRSGRQIYLYEGVDGGSVSTDAEPIVTFYGHETDAGLPRGIRDALVANGASQEAADDAIGELEQQLAPPYAWQALCFRVGDTVEMQGIAGVR